MKLSVHGAGLGGSIVVESDEGDRLDVPKDVNGYTAVQMMAEWLNTRTSRLEAEAARLDEQAGLAAATRAKKPKGES